MWKKWTGRNLEKEERARIQRIEKARKLQKSWELNRECRKIIQ